MRLIFLPCLFLVAACNAPSSEFRGVPATQVVVQGSTYDVRVRAARAEAIRINTEFAPRFGTEEQARVTIAIEQVSGCRVMFLHGDQAATVIGMSRSGFYAALERGMNRLRSRLNARAQL